MCKSPPSPPSSLLICLALSTAHLTLSATPTMPAVQGSALLALKQFFQVLISSKAKTASFDTLLSALMAAGQDRQIGKTAQHNIAQCIAVLCTSAGASQTFNTVKSLLGTVQGSDEIASRLALYSIGEIGRSTDLSKFKQLQVSY